MQHTRRPISRPMTELPDDDPRMEQFNTRLLNLLGKFVGVELSDPTLHRIQVMIDSERATFKLRYMHDIPKLVILALPSSQHLAVFRADLETLQIHIVLINLLREFGVRRIPVDRRELAIAVRRAWPSYDASQIIDMAEIDGQASHSLRN